MSPQLRKPEHVADSLLRRVELAKIARRLRKRLALAQFKTEYGSTTQRPDSYISLSLSLEPDPSSQANGCCSIYWKRTLLTSFEDIPPCGSKRYRRFLTKRFGNRSRENTEECARPSYIEQFHLTRNASFIRQSTSPTLATLTNDDNFATVPSFDAISMRPLFLNRTLSTPSDKDNKQGSIPSLIQPGEGNLPPIAILEECFDLADFIYDIPVNPV
ncbi:hypothetical protein BGZ63DRAFT_458371 [Mariannaea sp. PMI_226]|nr:hypothetical protein BGZ63DRAFT_458371 [Mariannaea sp. PMI_226]